MDKETKWKTTIISIVGALLLIGKQWIPELDGDLELRISTTVDQVVALVFLLMGMFSSKDEFKLSNFK